MCTLTIMPSEHGIIVSMNRDEANTRAEAGEHLVVDKHDKLISWWPVDSVSQGTWFGVRGDGLVAGLLNRYQNSSITPARSRGLIIPSVLANAPAQRLEKFIAASDWTDFAPFDLVLVHNLELMQCSWEGGRLQLLKASSAQPYLLSSSSIEYEESLQVRRAAFEDFIAQQAISPKSVIEELHRKPHSANPALGFLMSRPGRSTKSISQVVVGAAQIHHRYIPLHA